MLKIITFVSFVIIGLIGLSVVSALLKNALNIVKIRLRYGWSEEGQKLREGALWQGMTLHQLKLVVGKPSKIEAQPSVDSHRQINRYAPNKKGGYDLKVMIENDKVVAWFQK